MKDTARLSGVVLTRTQLIPTLARLRREGKRIVFTNGVFDLLHRGHVEYLKTARSLGDVLIVGMNTDSSVKKLKGPTRPLQNQRDRAVILTTLRCVDIVVLFGEQTPEKLIHLVRPNLLVKGADYRIAEIVGATFVKSYGGMVRRIPLRKNRSSSRLILVLESSP